MTLPERPPFHERLLAWPVLHPRATLGLTVAILAASLAAVLRMRAGTSLESWYSQEDAGARALTRVIRGFHALDTLQVLASLPPGGAAGDPDAGAARLTAFAERFEAELRGDSRTAAMCADIAWRTPPQARAFVEKVMTPAAVYYLNEAGWDALRRRLTRDGMAEQIRRNEAMISAPGAAEALAKAILRDPLRVHDLLLDRLSSLRPRFETFRGGLLDVARGGPAFIAPDGRSLLVRIVGRQPAGDMAFTKTFMPAVREAVARALPGDLAVAYAGGYAIAETSERSIRADAIGNSISSVVLLFLAFLVAYRNPFSFLLAFPPVAIGILVGFAIHALFSPTLSPPTAVLGGILAGLGIDYPIHYLSHYQGREGRAGQSGLSAVSSLIAPALVSACGTSIVSFLAIALSEVQALRDFSVLGSIGLAGIFVATLVVLPAALALWEAGAAGRGPSMRVRFSLEPLLRRLVADARWVKGIAGVLGIGLLLAAAASPGDVMRYETDVNVMHPRPNPALDTQEEIGRRFGMPPDSAIVYLRADSPEALLEAAHRVDQVLTERGSGTGGVAGAASRSPVNSTYGLAGLLPDPRTAAARRASAGAIDVEGVLRDFESVLDESVFDREAYRPYEEFLRRLLRPGEPPSTAALAEYPDVSRSILPRSAFAPSGESTFGLPTFEAITVVFLRDPPSNRERREASIRDLRASLAGVPEATLTGMSVLAHDTESAIRRDLTRLLGVSLAAVVLWLAVAFRSLRDMVVAMLPVTFGLLSVLAVTHLAEVRFNLVNLMALPMLVGIGVDNGIFLVGIARAHRKGGASADDVFPALAASGHAVLMANLTTILSFGSLMWTRTPAIASFGLLFAVGMGACLIAAVLILPPLLVGGGGRRERTCV